jgi:predicted nucleic acid-binding protein
VEVVDTSVLVLGTRNQAVRDWVLEVGDTLGVPDVVALEFLMGARSAADYAALETALSGFERLSIEVADWERARDVHRALAARGPGKQRSVRIPDLLIAAVAERHGAAVVHYDEDYDRIARITGQPARWVIPRGTV